jgi:FixJ family two-component response regulator
VTTNFSLRRDSDMTVRPSGFVIAVVDDDQGILRSLEYLLESADYAVLSFASAAALLDSDQLQEIDCVISDIDMPGKDGLELLGQIHSIRPRLPTILITGYPDRLLRLPLVGGAKPRAFTKPFQAEEFLAAIADAVGKPR